MSVLSRRAKAAWILPALAIALALGLRARAQDDEPDDDSPARLKAQLAVLKREIGALRGRVDALEAQVASLTSAATPVRPELTNDLGFVFPGMPRGTAGAQSAGDLAALLYQAAGRSEKEAEPLLAFGAGGFLVPDTLWLPATAGLKTLVGLPTRDEIDAVLRTMKPGEGESNLGGISELPDAAPKGSSHYLRVIELSVVVGGKTETYRLTAVRIGGRWFAAHLLFVTAEDEARALLDDLERSQWCYRRFYGNRYAKSLRELTDDREKLATNANLKAAGLEFTLGRWLDRKGAERLEWSSEGDLHSAFFAFRVSQDKGGGWKGEAIPLRSSYHGYSVVVAADAPVGQLVPVVAGERGK